MCKVFPKLLSIPTFNLIYWIFRECYLPIVAKVEYGALMGAWAGYLGICR